MNLLDVLLLVAATWRVTSIINRESIMEPLRKLFGEKLNRETGMYEMPDKFFSNLISCFLCLSVWVAAGMLVVHYYFPPIVYVFAISGLAIFMEKKLYG